MRILITNDDSITASQLLPLVRFCQTMGEVTVVVPKVEQSGKSHGIDIHDPFRVHKIALADDITALAVESTPADCVRFAILGLEMEFDLVISGVNRGYNIGSDILYSGTVSAACEGVLLGVPAIALSTSFENYENATEHLSEVFDYINKHKLMDIHNAYNVNIPPQGEKILITRQGGHFYSDDFAPVGDNRYQARGKCVYQDSHDDTLDTDAVMHGNISISPLTICRTNLEVYHKLTALNG
jgi:5'-nucleotidase